ncbi:cap-specific mRNA (nucleoside-2'-O-)-methyltransferase 2-like isoform X2 [Folsomia candida]|uniref:cap-specific mRNA (nucleoside-2'-O-)-methyltransferase 2-like isoform X2 n=1 Tax=Folsomia candida TaxID=158441 RepID=UPI0016054C23|nr:cap-specific mRNA (nucleoside-2'-O-)-methyltransferase 2-like isoform X2 [Folsomia candida]
METVVQDIWEKKRCLKSPDERVGTKPKGFFYFPKWTATELTDLEQELNETKSLLAKYPLDSREKHMRQMNRSGGVVPMVRKEFHPEFCNQAWCKMYECLSTFSLVPENIIKYAVKPGGNVIPQFLSIHLCEAPGGAFVSATNHYLSTNYPTIKWDWLATTLNPTYEGNSARTAMNADNLTFTSLNNWIFLKDTTGNIMNRKNFNSLIEEVQRKCQSFQHPVDLVTADGSIDVRTNPMEQESATEELQFVEMIAALSVLSPGGSFVLKVTSFLDCQSVCQLYILCSLFEEVFLFKPTTSNEDNSEIYAVCLKYSGRSHFRTQLKILVEFVGTNTSILRQNAMISRNILFFNKFMDTIFDAASFFTGLQVAAIKRYIKTWEDKKGLSLAIYLHELLQRKIAFNWIDQCDMRSLPHDKSLIPFRHIIMEMGYEDKPILHQSTSLFEQIEKIQRQIEYYHGFQSWSWEVSEISGSLSQLSPLVGRRYSEILSSRFCLGNILDLRSKLRAAVRPVRSLICCKIWMAGRKQCDACNRDRIRSHFSGVLTDLPDLCSETDWEFSLLCCAETVNDILHFSDAQRMKNCLLKLLLAITGLKVNQSLFLCTFPLLSRIQLGFIYALNSVFSMVVLSTGGNVYCSEYPQGILLHRYKGINSPPPDRELMMGLARIVMSMDNDDEAGSGEAIVEIVPAKNLIELRNFKDIFHYNMTNTANELCQIITETKDVIKQPDEYAE